MSASFSRRCIYAQGAVNRMALKIKLENLRIYKFTRQEDEKRIW